MAARKSLVEELAELVNPAPKSFEIEDLAFDTARVVEKDVDDEIEDFEEDIPSKLQIRAGSSLTQFKEDPRYAGKVISRKAMTGNVNLEEGDSNSEGDVYIKEHLEQVYGEGTDQSVSSSVSDGNQLSSGDEEVGSSGEDDPVPYNHSESDAEEGPSTPSEEEGPDTPSGESPLVITDRNLREEVEKGEAVKRQLRLWDGIVEGRIRLQKLLPLSNRLPQGVDMATFKDIGGTSVTQAVAQCMFMLAPG
jgi:protein AATF/BFR2